MSSTTTLIQNWFTRTWGGGLVLPDGWFGRPFDNIHRLTDVSQSSGLLRIVLDDQLTLTFNGDELVIDGYSELSFDWKEYGSDLPHSYIYQDGQTKLVAPPGQ